MLGVTVLGALSSAQLIFFKSHRPTRETCGGKIELLEMYPSCFIETLCSLTVCPRDLLCHVHPELLGAGESVAGQVCKKELASVSSKEERKFLGGQISW